MNTIKVNEAWQWSQMLLQEALLLPFTVTISFDTVDNILLPENRAHLSLEAQLKELLEKLDMVSTMRSSGARTRRIRLLRREINSIRQKLAQQQNKTIPNGEPVPREEGTDKTSREGDEEGEKGERLQQDFRSSFLVHVNSQDLLFLLSVAPVKDGSACW